MDKMENMGIMEITLSDVETKILNFLVDLHHNLKTSEVKSIDFFIKKHNVNNKISPVLNRMKIISKERPYKWLAETIPTKIMAIEIADAILDYTEQIANREYIEVQLKKDDEFKFSLQKLWKAFGYNEYRNAKLTLLDNCEKDKDYIVVLHNENNSLFNQKDIDGQILYLSELGFMNFCNHSTKPMAKAFLSWFFELTQKMHNNYVAISKGVKFISLESHLAANIEMIIKETQKFYNKIELSIGKKNLNPQLLSMSFSDKVLEDETIKFFNHITELGLSAFKNNQNTISDGNQLSEGFKALQA